MPIAKAATNVQLASLANRLRLTLIRDRMTEFLCMATEKKLTPRETLEYFFTQEILRREENRIRQGIMGAHFPMVRTLEGFSQTEQSAIDPRVLRELAQLEWLEQAQNVIFFGPPGTGKTHLTIGLGRAAITAGYKVAFYSTDHLVEKLEQAVKEGTMTQRLQQLSKPKLLIIDEFGYTPLSKQVAPWLFKLINMRYEHRSILITSNKSASEWAQVLGDTAMTTAILDRLLHHSKVILMQGESYRMLQAQKESVLQETPIEWAEQQPKEGAVTTKK